MTNKNQEVVIPECPICKTSELLVPRTFTRDGTFFFTAGVGEERSFHAGVCAGCGIWRVYRYSTLYCRREPVQGPVRSPRGIPLGNCPECNTLLQSKSPEAGNVLLGNWAVCVQCERAWPVDDQGNKNWNHAFSFTQKALVTPLSKEKDNGSDKKAVAEQVAAAIPPEANDDLAREIRKTAAEGDDAPEETEADDASEDETPPSKH